MRTFSAAPVAAESISQVVSAREPLRLATRSVAEAYGLGPDDFEHILSTFPVFARKGHGKRVGSLFAEARFA